MAGVPLLPPVKLGKKGREGVPQEEDGLVVRGILYHCILIMYHILNMEYYVIIYIYNY